MRKTTYVMLGVACAALAGCKSVYLQEGPAAAYLPQGVGFYEISGDVTNGQVAGKPYIVRRDVAVAATAQPVGEPIEVFAIEDLGLTE